MSRTQTALAQSPPIATDDELSDDQKRISQPAAAQLLGVSVRTVHRWRTDPEMKFPESVQTNNRHYFRRAEVLKWRQPNRTAPAQQDA
jgi:predicted DNA-binding transcriptional regulator AlpA